jgi:sugar/nucleoside kinase (ribokinase family)
MTATPIVVVGDLMVDVVAAAAAPLAHASDTDARVRWTGGGAAANVAAWLADAGVPVALVSRVGDDVAGRAAVGELRDAGVDVRAAVDPARATGTCVVVIGADGERTMLPDRGANLALAAEDLPAELFAAGGHLHLSGYVLLHAGPRGAGHAALERARAAGMTISVDPASAAPLRAAGAETVLGWIAGADVLLPNQDEAAVLTGEDDPERAARVLLARAGAREVVVTLGAGGALWTDGVAVARVPAVAAELVDTTGAGDAFAAGWLAARRGGAEAQEALHAACATGARAVTHAGARPTTGHPTTAASRDAAC